jgi:hypothetical protein
MKVMLELNQWCLEMDDRTALYVVGCNSWHENLKATFSKNFKEREYKKTWLQYNVDIRELFISDFSRQLQKYGYFFVYGHTKNEDYEFRNPIMYENMQDKIICINQKCDELEIMRKRLPRNQKKGAHVSVIYVVYKDKEEPPIISKDKQPPPYGAPEFKAYDITDGKCEQISENVIVIKLSVGIGKIVVGKKIDVIMNFLMKLGYL